MLTLTTEQLDILVKRMEKYRLKPIKIGDNYYYVWPNSKVPVKCKDEDNVNPCE